ncbi:MAG: hypothetical protein HUJ92_05290 [Bacteroidales bacterium]|nr:hypothetical protein [Bacteroidales bacterium]
MKEISFYKIVLRAIFFLWLSYQSAFYSYGQTVTESIAAYLEQAAESGLTTGIEELLELYEELERHPLNLKTAGREQLESLGILSIFQIESLLEYRAEYGAPLSVEELALVDGFSPTLAGILAPFISFGSENESDMRFHSAIRLRYVPGSHYGKTDGSYRDFYYNFTGRYNDEFLFSASAGWSTERLKMVIGDYSPRFGQGLLLWKGFSMNGSLSPANIVRRPSGFTPYKGTDKSLSFRGIGVSYSFSNGFNITSAIGARASGLNLSFAGENYKIGISGLLDYTDISLNKSDDGRSTSLSGSLGYGFSADGALSFGHLRLFSEVAYHKAFAAVAGAVYSLSYNFEASILFRYYPENYDGSFAGAYSSVSKVSNQHGITLKTLIRPSDKLLLQASAEYTYHPGPRYRIPVPSSVTKTILRIEYTPTEKWLVYSQWNFAAKSYEQTLKNDIRLGAKWNVAEWLDIQARGDCCLLFTHDTDRNGYSMQKGFAGFAEASFHFWRGKVLLTGRLTAFSTDGYPTRIYYYESDVPQAFSIPFYYDKGLSWYALVRYKYRSGCGLCLKISPKGLRLQADWKF